MGPVADGSMENIRNSMRLLSESAFTKLFLSSIWLLTYFQHGIRDVCLESQVMIEHLISISREMFPLLCSLPIICYILRGFTPLIH